MYFIKGRIKRVREKKRSLSLSATQFAVANGVIGTERAKLDLIVIFDTFQVYLKLLVSSVLLKS